MIETHFKRKEKGQDPHFKIITIKCPLRLFIPSQMSPGGLGSLKVDPIPRCPLPSPWSFVMMGGVAGSLISLAQDQTKLWRSALRRKAPD